MQSRRIVIDANILVRAVLGIRVRELIESYCDSTAFYVAESNVEEAMQYLGELTSKRGIREEIWQESLAGIMAAVQIIPQVELTAAEAEAMERIGQRDPADWPAVAVALQFDCRYGQRIRTFLVPASRPGRARRSRFFCAVSDAG